MCTNLVSHITLNDERQNTSSLLSDEVGMHGLIGPIQHCTGNLSSVMQESRLKVFQIKRKKAIPVLL